MSNHFETPILLIAFNRAENTKKALIKIKHVKPKKLFVSVDGPRQSRPTEKYLCDDVKDVVSQIDWDCEVKYLFHDINLGCKNAVTTAISWVFNFEDRVIVIEDDILASQNFFFFAAELLEKYKNNNKVGMISANNNTPEKYIESDYFFSKYGHIWGWATWKRVWDNFSPDLPELKSSIDTGLSAVQNLYGSEKKYFIMQAEYLYNKLKNNEINTWDQQFFMYRILKNYLSIVPKYNLASNIGVDSSRVNTKIKINRFFFPTKSSYRLVVHPSKTEVIKRYELAHFKSVINPPLILKAYNQVKASILYVLQKD